MSIAEIIFWVSAGCVAYSYAIYPALLFVTASLRQTARDLKFILARRNRRSANRAPFEPSVAVLVAAFNEESVIEQKIRNSAQIDYPAEKLEFWLGLDSPTDGTAARTRSVAPASFKVMEFSERRGKLAVIRDLAQRTQADVLVFSDANTMLEPDAVTALARHFADENVGAVCGELRVVSADGKPELESAYWRYEVGLKFLENRLNCVLGANGAVYAVRRELFNPHPSWIVEDFLVPMKIRFGGHRVVYAPEAVATEPSAPDFAAEFRRKVRIGAGDFQTLFRNPDFLNPLVGMPFVAYVSHKVLRWLGPLFLPAAWIGAGAAALGGNVFYAAAFALQTIFYALALFAAGLQRSGRKLGILGLPLYFAAMNLALFLGLLRFLTGRQKAVWASTPRNSATAPVSPATAKPEAPGPVGTQ